MSRFSFFSEYCGGFLEGMSIKDEKKQQKQTVFYSLLLFFWLCNFLEKEKCRTGSSSG
jgi:hypothetical protein